MERIGFLRDDRARPSATRTSGGTAQGYPSGLAGREIPLAARIVFACDTWHAMTSDRVYRRGAAGGGGGGGAARVSGSQLDPTVVGARCWPSSALARDLAA